MSEIAGAARGKLASAPENPLRSALLDSRQRWRDLVSMTADLAFETDAAGRLVFVSPDPALGWPAEMLIGQPAELLLAEQAGSIGSNPFRLDAPTRWRRAWLKRRDGSAAYLSFTAAPLLDRAGRIVGVRGVGLDVTELNRQDDRVAAALRRGEVLDHILWQMREEVLAPRMMEAALRSLMHALGAEGASVLDTLGVGLGPKLLYAAGTGADVVMPAIASTLSAGSADAATSVEATAPDGRSLLISGCNTRFGEHVVLAMWRSAGSRAWDSEEHVLATSAGTIIRVILEHDAIQREMGRQARTDPLTGLYNRRAFLEELDRRIERLEREELPGTLMFLDLDHFKPVNDRLGHEAGDEALRVIAGLLRNTFRPTDLIARLGGDEFAIWLDAADHLTAAERAEALRVQGPRALAHLTDSNMASVTMSIGIATRQPGSSEVIEALMRRADFAMYEVKNAGRGHWRVARETAR